jgi:hypothetical protein
VTAVMAYGRTQPRYRMTRYTVTVEDVFSNEDVRSLSRASYRDAGTRRRCRSFAIVPRVRDLAITCPCHSACLSRGMTDAG